MDKKGFTLIELLAIIVILAVIFGITIPIVLNIIDESHKGTAKISALGYKDAIMKYYMAGITDGSLGDNDLTGNYNILNGILFNTLEGSSQNYVMQLLGEKPVSGNVDINKGDLVKGCVQINKYAVVFNNSDVTKVEKSDCLHAVTITASDLEYTTEYNESITNVQEALNDLYEKVGN